MWPYRLNFKGNTNSKNQNETKNGRIMVISNCTVFNGKRSWFFNEEKASGLLHSSGIKTLSSRNPLTANPLF